MDTLSEDSRKPNFHLLDITCNIFKCYRETALKTVCEWRLTLLIVCWD